MLGAAAAYSRPAGAGEAGAAAAAANGSGAAAHDSWTAANGSCPTADDGGWPGNARINSKVWNKKMYLRLKEVY